MDRIDIRVAVDPVAQQNVSRHTITLVPNGKSCDIVSPSQHCDIAGVKPGVEYRIQMTASNSSGTSTAVMHNAKVIYTSSAWLRLSSVKTVKNFAGNSAALGAKNKSRVAALSSMTSRAQHFTCVGFAAGVVAGERFFELALDRAKVVCEKLVSSKAGASFDVKARVPGSKMIGANRKVAVRVYSPLQ
jgi:hypothetical protein